MNDQVVFKGIKKLPDDHEVDTVNLGFGLDNPAFSEDLVTPDDNCVTEKSCQQGEKGIQKCKTMGCFTVCYSLTGIVTSALNVYMNSQITTLEKQFNMSSSLSGILMSCNDFGYLVTTLLVSYYTRRIHVPRALALSTIFYGMSGLLCTVAFFGTRDGIPSPPTGIENITTPRPHDVPMCVIDNITMVSTGQCVQQNHGATPNIRMSESWRNAAILILGVGMVLQGVAKSPRHSFLGTYVDDNVPKTKTSMYLGTIVGLSISGPAIAFTLGGLFSKMYITLEETNMSPRDPRWLGAWWLGFVVFGTCGLVVGLPLIFFPKKFKPGVKKEAQDFKLTNKEKVLTDFKGFFRVMLRLVFNPVYVCLILSSGINLMCVSGMMAFMPKYLETQFSLPAWQANMYLGTMNVVAAFIGTIVGGCLTTRFKLSPLSCLKAVIASKCIGTTIVAMGFFVGCSQPVFQSAYFNSTGEVCACESANYFPVCGADNSNYFSPCHAGCQVMSRNNTFSKCVYMPANSTQTAAGNLCPSNCQTMFIFMALMFFAAFITTLALMPAFIVGVRSVPEVDKPVAIGLSSFSGTLLGWFPGPVIFGSLIDTTCLVWKKSCRSTGACLLYNIEEFRVRIHALMIGLRILSIILSTTALLAAVYFKKFSFQEHRDLEMKVSVKVAANQIQDDKKILNKL